MIKNISRIFIMITILMILTSLINVVKADILNPDEYKPATEQDSDSLIELSNNIIGAIQLIGSIISVISLSVIGIKYMIGSVEERAEYKQTMIGYLIGAVMLFAISNILAILYDVIQGMS